MKTIENYFHVRSCSNAKQLITELAFYTAFNEPAGPCRASCGDSVGEPRPLPSSSLCSRAAHSAPCLSRLSLSQPTWSSWGLNEVDLRYSYRRTISAASEPALLNNSPLLQLCIGAIIILPLWVIFLVNKDMCCLRFPSGECRSIE